MNLAPGTRLGPYEVFAPLGAGGMGEVYRAKDTRLGRDVAIKSLPEEFALHADRLARFEREAKLLASLSHPNIAGIHGLEDVGGARYLILEFVEGETLAARIERGPLPVDEAISTCRDIAAGVEAAHESGVIHRDLKPGNVMITPSAAVKVLDFGLARAGATERSASDSNLSVSPTLTSPATQAGVILGTAAYMSPEQARGRPVDRRTDIWSFGCVLYECLTGRRVFEGDTVSDVMARILEREPDWSALPAATPPRLRDLLQRCLRKDARERLRDIGEARVALDEMARGVTVPDTEASVAPRTSRRGLMIAAGLVVLTAVVSVLATRLLSPRPVAPAITLSAMLPRGERLDGGSEQGLLAISPDGRSLAYTARSEGGHHLYLRRLDRPDAVEVPGTADAHNPFFSPDGEWVGFFAGRHMLKASARGGSPVELADAISDRSGVWLDDDTIVYSPSFASPLFRISANGGTPDPVTVLDSTQSERSHRWPCALPGGEWIVFTVGVLNSPGGYDDASIEAVSLRTRERRKLARGSYARYAPGKRLIIARGGSLYAMPIDPADPRSGVTAVPVLDGVLGVETSGVVFFDIARDGTLVLVPGREDGTESKIAWCDLNGNRTEIPGDPRDYQSFAVSPDGTQALAAIGPGGGDGNVFLLDLVRGRANQVTFGGHDASPHWMPDGVHFVWSTTTEDGTNEIVLRSVLGGDSTRVLVTSRVPLIVTDVRPDGSSVLFIEYGVVDSDLSEVSVAGGDVRRVVREPGSQSAGVLSPDGRWIAYVTQESGTREVCVRPPGRAGGRVQISSGGGLTPVWSPDGHALYYIQGNSLMAVRIAVQGDVVIADTVRRLFDLPFSNSDGSVRDFDVHPSGEKFLVRVVVGKTNEMREIMVRLNWASSPGALTGEGGR